MTYNFLQAELKPEDNTQIIAVADIKAPLNVTFTKTYVCLFYTRIFMEKCILVTLGKKCPNMEFFFRSLTRKPQRLDFLYAV